MDTDELDIGGIFPEPPRPPSPEPTIEIFNRDNETLQRASERSSSTDDSSPWDTLRIRLVGSHPLWGHHLWNAARSFATYLDENATSLCEGKAVLELGAGGALPGIVAALSGAHKVVLTDYPDYPLIQNMSINVEQNIPQTLRNKVFVDGYIWGTDPQRLLDALSPTSTSSGIPSDEKGAISDLSSKRTASLNNESSSSITTTTARFDLILLSDLIFNHSQHDALLTTCEQTLAHEHESVAVAVADSKPSQQSAPTPMSMSTHTPTVLVFYTHHRPHLAHRDLNFFEKAKARGWICEEFFNQNMGAMFPDDPGDVEVRSVVHGWRMYRS